jgi:hypothetical protein
MLELEAWPVLGGGGLFVLLLVVDVVVVATEYDLLASYPSLFG